VDWAAPGVRSRIGPYEVEGLIGAGGMGRVVRARHVESGQIVALKVIGVSSPSPLAEQRFIREARVLAKLRHPNIAALHNAGVDESGPRPERFLAMELVDGARSIIGFAADQRRGIRERVELFTKVCDAVHEAHMHGIVHRDLKPSNILVDGSGVPKVIDFGVARLLGEATASDATQAGSVVGTLDYMSPEQAAGETSRVDWRSDVYALGAVLCELLTGRLPHDLRGKSMPEVTRTLQSETPKIGPSTTGTLLGPLRDILHMALANEPGDRYASALELKRDLERYLADEPVEAAGAKSPSILLSTARRMVGRRPGLAIAIAAILVAIGGWHAEAASDRLGFDRAYRGWLAGVFPRTTMDLEKVRVIALTDDTDIASLAASQGIEGVLPFRAVTFRPLHGALMERLADVHPAVVVFDISFTAESRNEAHDKRFVRGLQALDEAGVPVVVGLSRWELDSEGLPPVNPRFVRHVRWGGMSGDFDPRAPWRLDLAWHGSREPTLPSLSLAALAAFHMPDAWATYAIDKSSGEVEISFWKLNRDVPGARAQLGAPLRVRATRSGTQEAPNSLGIAQGDTLALLQVDLPPNDVLEAATIDFGDALASDAGSLAARVAGRVVLIGNQRAGVDRKDAPDGRRVPGFYAHAAGIQSLIDSVASQEPRPLVNAALFVKVSLVGGALAAAGLPGRLRVGVICLAFGILVTALCVGVYPAFNVVVNPLGPSAAAVLSGILGACIWATRLPTAK